MNTKPTWVQSDIDELAAVFLHLDSLEEVKLFLDDICTEKEIIEIANRWKVARMLIAGLSWKKIEKITGVSSATIAKVAKRMQNKKGGIAHVLSKLV